MGTKGIGLRFCSHKGQIKTSICQWTPGMEMDQPNLHMFYVSLKVNYILSINLLTKAIIIIMVLTCNSVIFYA